jgi:3-oxoacyl-[acyl-carrier protein] reductase
MGGTKTVARERKGSRLLDEVAIITGGANGLGRAYCLAMAAEGAKVTIPDVDWEGAQAVAQAIQERGGEALPLRTDVSSPQDVEAMVKATVERFGRIDILVNNASLLWKIPIARGPFMDISLEEWHRMLEVNLTGSFLCIRAVFPYMKEQGRGRIINISSGAFFSGSHAVHYTASKGGVIGMTRAFAWQLGPFGITVNCVAPGATVVMPNDPDHVQRRTKMAEGRAIKRAEYPEDLIGSILFFASEDSEFVTGQTLLVDGGAQMH